MTIEKNTEPFYNCHIHTFTLDHIPKRFIPFGITRLLRGSRANILQRSLRWLFRNRPDSIPHRYASFLETADKATQKEVFDEVKGFYPSNTRFVILPMDMAFMGAGEPFVPLKKQLEDQIELVRHYKQAALPFLPIDPRRFDSAKAARVFAEEWFAHNRDDYLGGSVFRGVKLYPPQGYHPNDPKLHDVYALCQDLNVPIMTHCNPGGVHSRHVHKTRIARYTNPDSYIPILRKFKDLRICLAHFGGTEEWERYFKDPKSRVKKDIDAGHEARLSMNWLTKIMQLMAEKDFKNLYTDVSYTVFAVDHLLAPLSVILQNEKHVLDKTLFGSDYYMSHQEKFDERFLSMKLRHALGEKVFDTIARKNPKTFLNIKD
ncbi:MAG: amidohydrolase family protein [Pseudomonadota bacterium]